MALEPDELAEVRTEIGSADPPSDSDLDDIHDRVLGLVGVIRAVWATRLAEFLSSPASFTIPGEYGQNAAANIEGIQKRLKELSGLPDDSNDIPPGGLDLRPVTSFQLVRPDCGR